MKIKLAVLVGSLRKDSYNLKLAKHVMNRYQDQFDFNLLDLDMPLYNEDINVENLRPESVLKFFADINQADAFLFISPEYNHTMSSPMKNAIDWGSRQPKGQHGLAGQIGFTMNCANGFVGGARAHVHLRDSVNGIGMNMLPSNEVLINFVQNKFDEDDKLTDEATVQFIDTVMDNFIKYYHRLED